MRAKVQLTPEQVAKVTMGNTVTIRLPEVEGSSPEILLEVSLTPLKNGNVKFTYNTTQVLDSMDDDIGFCGSFAEGVDKIFEGVEKLFKRISLK